MATFFGRTAGPGCNENAKPRIKCRQQPGAPKGVRQCAVEAGPRCGRTFVVDPSPRARASAHAKKLRAGNALQRKFHCTRSKVTGKFQKCVYLGPRGQ